MTFGSDYGIKIDKPKNLLNLMECYFSEDQGRYVIEIQPDNHNKISEFLNENNIFNETIGIVQKDYFEVSGQLKIKTNNLYKSNNTWYNNY